MASYRFKTAEIEAMKKNILTHIEHETETKTAWRLRCAIEGQLMCCRPSKREAARLERELALYEKLTKNDLPNWQGEPTQTATLTETPQISTETAEAVNVSVEGENAAERKEIEVQTIADMVAIGESLNIGESVSFKLHLHFLWSVTITNESAEWCEEFKYSLNAKCLDNPQSFGRRYTSFGLAMLHCLNRFNENANIRDDYETLSAALNKPQNLISDFRAPQSPEAPQMKECIDEPCKLAQTA